MGNVVQAVAESVVAPNRGTVDIHCCECEERYYCCDADEWGISGTIIRRRGYCPSCYKGAKWNSWWSGNVVKLNCKKCDHTYSTITWDDWKQIGTLTKYEGYCRACYNRRH